MNDLERRLQAALFDETTEVTASPELADQMVARGTKVRRQRRVAVGVAGLAVLAAVLPLWKAIDTSAGPLPPAKSVNPTVITQAPPTTPTTPQQTNTSPEVWSSTPVEALHVLARPTHVVNLRVATHDTYDRVVIDFEGKLPGYHIRYVPALIYDGSGGRVPLNGERFIQISLTSAAGHDDQGNDLYAGDRLKAYDFPALLGAAYTGDVGEIVSFGLAVSHRAGFRVSTLAQPTRLVIDLQH